MKKILPLMVVGILILSGFGAVAITEYKNYDVFDGELVTISEPTIKEAGQYVAVSLKGSTSSLLHAVGKPILPVVTRVFTFPFGSKINSVDVSFSEIKECALSKKVQPAPEPIPLVNEILEVKEPVKDENVYGSEELYPSNSYSYNTGAGLNGKEHVIYLVVQCYPVRYSPAKNMIYYSESIDIKIIYEEPKTPTVLPDEYDLVIIAPAEFSAELQPLVNHKNSFDLDTILKTTEEIYSQYGGVDKPEQIKYFIKDAFDTWGIEYVLLVGGLNSLIYAERKDDCNQGSKDWHVPVRYTNLRMGGSVDDPGFISDLYYADIYDGEGNFSSWDKDKNGESDGIFANWKYGAGRDIIDLVPEVYVGRLACRNTNEVKIMVNKIINYESSPSNPSWFKKMVVIGGDTFDDHTDIYEGEVENQKALDYMADFEPIKLWASNKNTGGLVPEPNEIIKTVSDGCGFLHFAGHGSPELWYTYYPYHEEKVGKLFWFNAAKMSNGDKLPVCVVGSCHGSQFNVTALSFIDLYLNKLGEKFNIDFLKRWGGNCGSPTPECFCWFLTRVKDGGPISTVGNTGIGYGRTGNNGDLDGDGVDDPDCIEKFGGYIETLFFKEYGVENIDILGEIWGHAVTDYLNVYPGMNDQTDCKTVEQWILFGDPSLKIGGYP
jgi:hypothetical protein